MAFCSKKLVPFLPTPWRDLKVLDDQILAEMATKQEYLDNFFRTLEHEIRERTTYFAEKTTYLHSEALKLLSPSTRAKYPNAVAFIEALPDKTLHGTIFSGYDWLRLPPRWDDAQGEEAKMITYIEEHPEDRLHLFNGLKQHFKDDAGYSRYWRLFLSVVAMYYRYYKDDPEYMKLLKMVQSTPFQLIPGDEYNNILLRYGCVYGRGGFVGWGLENDPSWRIEELNAKILELEARVLNPEEVVILQGYYQEMRDIAKPWRVTPPPYPYYH